VAQDDHQQPEAQQQAKPQQPQPSEPQAAASRAEQTEPQSAAAAAQKMLEKAQSTTRPLLQRSTLREKYYLFQAVRQNPPNQLGVSDTPSGPLLAADVVSAAEADQLYQPFGAVFDLLGSFNDAGSGAYPAAQSGIQTEVLGKIEWASEHYGYKNTLSGGSTIGYEKKLDFSFGGAIGIYPALVLENLSSTTTTILQPLARPMFQDAFQWEIGPRINRPLFLHGEASLFVNFGQNFLINQVTSFKQGDNTVTATPCLMVWEEQPHSERQG
jgi:hypothetical protein